jgi:hypothetical protein
MENPNSSKALRDAAKAKKDDLTRTSQLRKEFIDRQEVKDYVQTNTNVSAMKNFLTKAQTGDIQNQVALDQALITMFNKLTDPQSVVRESEYARTPQNLSLVNRFGGAVQKLQKGGAGLTNADREALVWGAEVILDERGKTYNNTLDEYNTLAGGYEVEPDLVTRGMKKHTTTTDMKEEGDMVKMKNPEDGKTYEVPESEVEEAKKNGWR